jgi:hypothetical protein
MRIRRGFATLALGLVIAASPAVASPIILPGSNLLTGANASQLETWLGSPLFSLTKIFDKTAGDGKTATDFHAAADNLGPTFSIFRARLLSAPDIAESYQLIGGYNPASWSSIEGYDVSPGSFVFNLTTSTKQEQLFSGSDAAYSHPQQGPAFGAGWDLVAGNSPFTFQPVPSM